MKQFDSRRAMNIALSILAALVIWVYVGNVDDSEITARANDVPVVYTGEDSVLADRGLMLISGSVDTVDLKLKAKRNVLYQLDTRDVKVVVDLSNINAVGVYTLSYSPEYPSNVQKSRISVDSASVYTVTVTIGELYKKTVDLKYEISGDAAEGYLAQSPVTEVTTLDIHGQQADVIRVSYAKVSYDLSGAKASVNEMADFTFYDSANRPIEDVKIYANHKQVPLSIPVYQVKEVDLTATVKEVAGLRADDVGISVQPQTLCIAGESYLVEELTELAVAEIDLADIGGGVNRTIRLQLPQGIISVDDVREVTVSITLSSGVGSRGYEVTEFSLENVPEGMEAVVRNESLRVLLRGRTAALDSASAEKIMVSADISAINGSGTYSVPAAVSYAGDEDLGVIGSYELSVELRRLAADPEQ